MKLVLNIKYVQYSIIHILLFIASCIVGLFVGQAEENIGHISFLNKPFYEYFMHNVSTCIVLIGIGVVSYGCLTWLPLVYNGIVLGMAINFLSYSYSVQEIIKLFAHSIFEIPALMISIYLGKALAVAFKNCLLMIIKQKKLEIGNKKEFLKIILVFLVMILFLFIASLIEAIPK